MNNHLETPAPFYMNRPPLPAGVSRAVAMVSKLWPTGSILTYKHLGGTQSQQDMSLNALLQIQAACNLDFALTDRDDADIRIGYERGIGCWSMIGTDANLIDPGKPTMNFDDWADPATVRHEMGHGVGLLHGQSNPGRDIQWDKPAVYKAMARYGWSKEKVDHNFFKVYEEEQISWTVPDPKSVMNYKVGPGFTLDGVGLTAGDDYSELDLQHLADMYPLETTNFSQPTLLLVDDDMGPYEQEIGQPGEEDLYRFHVDHADSYRLITSGATDVVMHLYGPDSQTKLIHIDDDSGLGMNADMTVDLEPGAYTVQIRHFFPDMTGEYAIGVYSV